MTSATFRANVGILLHDRDGNVLAFERIGRTGCWQAPQGGLEVGEDPRVAALRELQEETGIPPEKVRLVAEHPSWLTYLSPRPSEKLGLGQTQKWMLAEFLGTEADIQLEGAVFGDDDSVDSAPPEFSAYRWIRLQDLAREVADFKRGVYSELVREFGGRLDAMSGGVHGRD